MRVLFVNFNSLKRYLSVVKLYAQVAVPVDRTFLRRKKTTQSGVLESGN